MAGSTSLLYRFLGVDEGAGLQFDRMSKKTAMLGEASTGALSKVAMLAKGLTLAGVVVGVGAIKMAGDFQGAMLRIRTQAGGTQKQVDAMSKGVLQMAGAVGATPMALADAAYHIASVGQKSFTTAQQLQILRVASEGAKLGGANLTDVTNALDAALVSHMSGVKNYSQAMGVLNATVGAGDMSMQDLADAFGPIGAVLKGYNVNIRQAGAALATFGDNNLRGAQAGTALRMSVQALAVPSAKGQAILRSWGLAAGDLSKQLLHGGLTGALDTLMQKMRENGITAKTQGQALTEVFGKRAGIGLAVLEGQLGRFHTKLAEVSKGATGFGSSWKAYTKSFGFAWDSAKASAESMMIQLGTKLLPIATKVMNWITSTAVPALERFAHWLEQNSRWTKPLAIGIAALGFALASGPVGWAIELAVALVLLYKRSATFRAEVKLVARDAVAAWNWMKNAGTAVVRVVGAAWTWFANGPLAWVKGRIDDFTKWYDAHAEEIRTATSRVWKFISLIVVTNWKIIEAFLKPALVALKTMFKVTWDLIVGAVKTGVKVLGDLFKYLQHIIQNFIAVVVDIISGKWGKAWQDAKKLVSQAFTDIAHVITDFAKGALGMLFNAGKDVVRGLINGVKSMFGAAKSAIGSIGHGIKSGFSAVMGILSPSKVFFRFGVWIVQGLVNGVKTYTVKAKSVAKELAIGFITGWKDGSARLKDALTTPVQATMEKLTTIVTTAINKQAAKLKTSQTALANLLKQRASDVANLAGSIAQGAGLSSLFGSNANGDPTVDNVSTYLTGQAQIIQNFAKDLQWGAQHGLSPVLLSQIADLGAVQGDQVMKQFMTGAASIRTANTAESAIQKFSTSAASNVENAVYAKSVAADKKAVADNTSELKKLTAALHRIEVRTAKAASLHLSIDAKTGRPTVDKKFIDDILKGIRQAERVAGKKLI